MSSIAHPDVIIIGSGFAGSIMADRLVKAGAKVIVLERGPWRQTPAVKKAGIVDTTPLPQAGHPMLTLRGIRGERGPKAITLNKKGLLEIHAGRQVTTISSSSVGGGSHVWGSGIALPVQPGYWDGRAPGVSTDIMRPHYDRIKGELNATAPLNARDLPNHASYVFKGKDWFDTIPEGDQYQSSFHYPPPFGGPPPAYGQSSELRGKDCPFGSPNGAKGTLDAIYLLPNIGENLTVLDLHEVLLISSNAEQGYTVTARDHRHKQTITLRASKVVLGAGVMNTVKLLSESQQRNALRTMPSLGKGFGTNGDCVGTWQPTDQERKSRLGPPGHGRVRIHGQSEGINILLAGDQQPPLPKWLPDKIVNALFKDTGTYQLVAMAEDNADGHIRFDNGRLSISYDIANSRVYGEIFSVFNKIADKTGYPVKFSTNSITVAHPLGGCRIASSPQEGVVDGFGEVYGNPGLYIADASALPAAPAVPPSLTIAAWAAHVARGLVSKITS